MSDSILSLTVEKASKQFRDAKNKYENRYGILNNQVDVYAGSAYDLLRLREVVRESVKITIDFRTECQAIIISLDDLCRPMLSADPSVREIGSVSRLIDEIVKEMKDATTKYTLRVNGLPHGDITEVSADPGSTVLAIQMFWNQKYETMPGYTEDKINLAKEAKEQKQREQDANEREIVAILESDGWLQIDTLCDYTYLSRQRVSAILRKLMASERVVRHEYRDGYDIEIYFGLTGTPIPESLQSKNPPESEREEPVVEDAASSSEENEKNDSTSCENNGNKKKKSRLPIIIIAAALVIIALVAASAAAVIKHQNELKKAQEEQLQAQREQEETMLMLEEVINHALMMLEDANPHTVEFSAAERNALSKLGIQNIYRTSILKRAIAEKLSQLYKSGDFDSVIRTLEFLLLNSAVEFDLNVESLDVCFSEDYINAFKSYVEENGTLENPDSLGRIIYDYNGMQIIHTNKTDDYKETVLSLKYVIDGVPNYIILGDTDFRRSQYAHSMYKDQSPGYYLIGDTVEVVFDHDATDGNCTRCSGTGKVTEKFGANLSERPGYAQGSDCGGCDATGWK